MKVQSEIGDGYRTLNECKMFDSKNFHYLCINPPGALLCSKIINELNRTTQRLLDQEHYNLVFMLDIQKAREAQSHNYSMVIDYSNYIELRAKVLESMNTMFRTFNSVDPNLLDDKLFRYICKRANQSIISGKDQITPFAACVEELTLADQKLVTSDNVHLIDEIASSAVLTEEDVEADKKYLFFASQLQTTAQPEVRAEVLWLLNELFIALRTIQPSLLTKDMLVFLHTNRRYSPRISNSLLQLSKMKLLQNETIRCNVLTHLEYISPLTQAYSALKRAGILDAKTCSIVTGLVCSPRHEHFSSVLDRMSKTAPILLTLENFNTFCEAKYSNESCNILALVLAEFHCGSFGKHNDELATQSNLELLFKYAEHDNFYCTGKIISLLSRHHLLTQENFIKACECTSYNKTIFEKIDSLHLSEFTQSDYDRIIDTERAEVTGKALYDLTSLPIELINIIDDKIDGGSRNGH